MLSYWPLLVLAAPTWAESAGPSAPWTIVERTASVAPGDWVGWQVDYRLRNDGEVPQEIAPQALAVHVEGWVSNSRVAGHETPRASSLDAAGRSGLRGSVELIRSADESRRCRERLVLVAWPDSLGPTPPEPLARAHLRALLLEEQPTWRIEPGQMLRVRLRLEHEHPLHGHYHALLGTRRVELQLGSAVVRDSLRLDREPRVPRPSLPWPPSPPAEFLDTRVFLSAPDSLHLEAHIPGKQSYRYPEYRRVRAGARMRLSFWYLIAPGSEGQCQARVTQIRDLPNSWRTLYDAEVNVPLTAVGRWVRVERVFRAASEANLLAVDFRIMGAEVNVGELWIDDVRLEPMDEASHAAP